MLLSSFQEKLSEIYQKLTIQKISNVVFLRCLWIIFCLEYFATPGKNHVISDVFLFKYHRIRSIEIPEIHVLSVLLSHIVMYIHKLRNSSVDDPCSKILCYSRILG